MNAGLIEKAFESALQNAAPALHIAKMADETTTPNDTSFAVVACERCENVVANLWKATIRVIVTSPAPSVSLDDHGNVVTTIVNAVHSPSLYTAYNSAAIGHTSAGGKILDVDLGIEENNYTHTISILLGIVRS
jgi:hypothetical protein